MLFLFDNKIIIEKIASLFESLNKTEENLKKEIIELKEIKKIAEILNKDTEIFKEFFEFIDLLDIENSKKTAEKFLSELDKDTKKFGEDLEKQKQELEKILKSLKDNNKK